MVITVTSPPAPDGDRSRPQGYCSQCGKIWTLNERQGIVCGVLSLQAIKAPLQSPAISSLGQTEGESKIKATATAITTLKVNG